MNNWKKPKDREKIADCENKRFDSQEISRFENRKKISRWKDTLSLSSNL